METVINYAPPFIISNPVLAGLFLITPGILAALGARLLQGSFLRIVGAAIGAGSRDFGLLWLVSKGYIEASNPNWDPSISFILCFFCASAGALFGCLTPYRGPALWAMAFIGGVLGQFLLPYVLGIPSPATPSEIEVLRSVFWFTGI